MPPDANDPVAAFIVAATVPRDRGHASGTTERADALLAAHAGIANASIYTAAILGDDAGVRRWIALDPALATATGGPHAWDALTYLCFSSYLKRDRARSADFVRAATALLDAGASANTGWTEHDHQPEPAWEPVLYGAAGIAHHPELTRLLLDRGADPNDDETCYHTPESYDNGALEILVATGRVTDENLVMMLIRKHDWHDGAGARFLLEHGANPNLKHRWGALPLHHALARDNALAMFELLLDHGADPRLEANGLTAFAVAAREGRSDVLQLFAQRGIRVELTGADRLIAAVAMDDAAGVRTIVAREPHLVPGVIAMGGDLLATFSGTDNAGGIRQLLDLGVNVAAPFTKGDGYYGQPPGSLAIHIAAWRLRLPALRVLLERGSPINVPDARGRTPLALAVRASVDSYWTERALPEFVTLLLDAGASASSIPLPTGSVAIDALLSGRRA